MRGTLFEAESRAKILGRLASLTPENERRWGRLSIAEVVPHMADQLRMALGDIQTSAPRGPLRFRPMRYLVIHVLPWPKGRAKGPREAFTTDTEGFAADVERLAALIERFARQDPRGPWPPNPVFGPLTGHDWGVLSLRHLDHHLKQFSA